MKTYAQIANSRVVEIIEPMVYDISSPPDVEPAFQAGDEVPIERRFTDSFVDTLVEISGAAVSVGDVYANGSFSPYIPPAPSLADVVARNTAMRDALLTEAGARIAPLQDAVDLGDATDAETAMLKSWKQFRVAVNRIDLTATSPAWPAEPA